MNNMDQMLAAYRAELARAMEAIDAADFGEIIDILIDAYRRDAQVFVAGNGGSAGTANHFVCDFGKNAVPWDRRRFRIHSLSDNIEFVTALANDIAYDQTFVFQMENLMRSGDVLIAISASGSSPNIVGACAWARAHGMKVIALSGFGGGRMVEYADAKLVTDMRSYERIEDLHLIILHMIVCWFKDNPDRL